MKNIFYLSILLFLPLLTWGQSQDKNYVLSRTYTKPTTGTITADDFITTVQYYDGLGRPIQRLDYKAGGNKQDIVTPIVYDQGGNTTKSYLPYANQPKVPNSLDYRDNTTLIPTIESLYYSKFPNDFTSSPLNPYSETFHDNSPLNRVLKQGAPGSDWRGNATNDNNHTIRKSYSSNKQNKVYRFKVTFPTGNTEQPELNIAEYYQPNELYKTVTKNENWTAADGNNNTTEEFKDKEGRVVLTRAFNEDKPHDTYYVYDKYSNLTFVIPPVAADDIVQEPQPGTFSINTSVIDGLCYIYRYDYRNRVVEKKIPGKGWEYMIYDKLNRVILTQDDKTRTQENKWFFTKYDQFDRVVYTGSMFNGTSRSTMQSSVNNQSSPVWHEKRSSTTFSGNGVNVYYTNLAFPKANQGASYTVNTINYYDDYNAATIAAPPSTVYGENVTTVTKSLPTASWVRAMDANDPNKYIATTLAYDKKGRQIYSYKNDTYLKYSENVELQLDFTGKVLTQKTNHNKQQGTQVIFWVSTTFVDYFTYDHMGRMLKHTQGDWEYDTNLELISSNTYNDLGQLVQKKVGGKATASTPLQTLDYTYNVRGWLKAVNNPDMTLSGGDMFAFRINYNQTSLSGSTALYNGNISETYWRSKTDNRMRSYSYKYDDLNRLTDANYTKQYGLVTNPSAIENYTEGSIKYDKNGNITSLVRWGLFDDHGMDNIDKIDVLSYVYEPFSNRLRSVSDTGGTDEGFYNGSNTTVEYEYDINGNMTRDRNKKIQSIAYNYLNLPTRVVFEGGSNTIDYIYDAAGRKLKKTVTNSGNVTVTEYNGGFVYVKENSGSNNLQYIPMAEGYITKGPNVGGETFKYVYQFKDHLGNVRLTYTDVDGNGSIANNEVIEESNYYAFGLQHKGYNANVNLNSNGNAVAQKWKYNSIELEEALGYNMYEMDARQYDPALARWVVIDPVIHHSMSPYNAFDNNPVFWADPSGADAYNTVMALFNRSGSGLTTYTRDSWFAGGNIFTQSGYDSLDDPYNNDRPAENASQEGGGGGVSMQLMGDTISELFKQVFKKMQANSSEEDLTFKLLAHGNKAFIQNSTGGSDISDADLFDALISELNPQYAKAIATQKEFKLFLFSCWSGSNPFDGTSIAQKISEKHPTATIYALDGRGHWGLVNNEPKFLGIGKASTPDKNGHYPNDDRGSLVIFRGGNEIGRLPSDLFGKYLINNIIGL